MPKAPAGDESFDRRIGIGLGIGMTQAALAEHLQVSENTIGNHLKKNRTYIDQVCNETKGLMARRVVDTPIDGAEAKAGIRDEAWKMLYTLIRRDDLRPGEQIALIREGLDRTEGKAVNRIHMLGEVKHEHTVQIPSRIFDALDTVLKEQKLLPAVIDIESVP